MSLSPDQQLILDIAEHSGLSASAVARQAGLAASTLTRIAHGHQDWRLSATTMDRLRETFPDFFERREGAQQSSYLEVEVLPSYVGMGGGGFGDGDREITLVPRRLIEERLRAAPADLLMIDVRGDSMEPDFQHGDQVLIDKRDTNPTQPGPFMLFDGDTYVMKLVERLPGKRGWLRIFSANSRYSPYEVEEDGVRIMGRPVWFARAL